MIQKTIPDWNWVDKIKRKGEVAEPNWVVHKLAGDGPLDHMIFCPACECGHGFNTTIWGFNGDMVKPTLFPKPGPTNPEGHCSVKVEYFNYKLNKMMICHFHINNGMISFCDDCTHHMAKQTVALEPF